MMEFERLENISGKKEKMLLTSIFLKHFLAPLAEGQEVYIMTLCLLCISLSVHLLLL